MPATLIRTSDPLLQPYKLKHLTLKNRIMSTAHEPNYHEDGMPKERYRLYHVERAKGGIALTMTAGSAVVSRDSSPAFGNLLAYKDEIVPWLRELADECHEHGAAVMIQLTHLGRRASWNSADWLPVLSPSPVREPAHRAFPKELEDWDIERIIGKYADAAERMQAGGMDGVEVEAYGHLFDQFLSPLTNRRDDEWGGAEGRARFGTAVLTAIRERVGPEFIVGIRMVIDETVDGGIDTNMGLAALHAFEGAGLIDFVNVIKGHIESDEAISHVIPTMGTPAAPHLEMVKRVKQGLSVPILHAARIADVATARHAVSSGAVDLIGMTRAHMADPHIVAKVMRGETSPEAGHAEIVKSTRDMLKSS